jgi:YHS domain-containing protein
MPDRFKVLSIVRRENSRIWYLAKQLLAAVVFSLFLIPVLPIQAQQLTTPTPTASTNRTVDHIPWLNNLEQARALSALTNQPIFIHFVQDGCSACEYAATQTFQNRQLIATIHSQYIPVKINISQADAARQRFRIKHTPTDVILDIDHTMIYRELTVLDPMQYIGILDSLEIAVFDDLAISTGFEFDPTDTTEPATNVAHVNESFVTTASYPQQQTRPQVSSTTARAQPTKTTLGLDGYCCVSLTNQDGTAAVWIKGKPQIGIKHRDRIYLFSNQQNLQLFLSNPDKFSPVLSGFDPVLFTDHRRLIDGQRKYGVAYKKRVYLFQNEFTLRAFWNSPDRYAQAALDAMNRTR